MFNKGELGGLCILRGCMPTKTMLHAAHLAHEAAHHRTPGVSRSVLATRFAEVMANKDAKVARFQRAKIAGIDAGGYRVVQGRARFVGPDTVQVGDTLWRFRKGAVLATGSVPTVPPIPGLEQVDYWSSDDVMELTDPPTSTIVVGSGAIGLELGQFLARMGTQVHLVSRKRIFEKIDPVLADAMAGVLADEPNLTNHAPGIPMRVSQNAGGIHMEVSAERGAHTVVADRLLMATGRAPAVQAMGLEEAGVEVVDGRVVCGPDMRTSNPKIFVAGDASGERLLLHVANWAGSAAGRGAAGFDGDHRVARRLHMTVGFTHPPLATIGATEAEARAAGEQVVTATARIPETGRAITMDVPHGVWKLVARAVDGEILGSQILGPRADDIVHSLGAVMYYRGTAAHMLEMPWYHPTLSEVALSLARDIAAQVS